MDAYKELKEVVAKLGQDQYHELEAAMLMEIIHGMEAGLINKALTNILQKGLDRLSK